MLSKYSLGMVSLYSVGNMYLAVLCFQWALCLDCTGCVLGHDIFVVENLWILNARSNIWRSHQSCSIMWMGETVALPTVARNAHGRLFRSNTKSISVLKMTVPSSYFLPSKVRLRALENHSNHLLNIKHRQINDASACAILSVICFLTTGEFILSHSS